MMVKRVKKYEVIFFQTSAASEPVREWLSQQTKETKRIIGEDIKTVQFGWPLTLPLVGSLGGGLWEVRSTLSDKRIARVIFFIEGNAMVLINAFIKKAQKTPKPQLTLSRKRKKQYDSAEKKERKLK